MIYTIPVSKLLERSKWVIFGKSKRPAGMEPKTRNSKHRIGTDKRNLRRYSIKSEIYKSYIINLRAYFY